MTVVSTTKDAEALTLVLVAELDAPVERVWRLWSDPRQLERWWGPPCWPATFEEHDLRPGGRARYYMTGPNGEKSRSWWRVLAVDEPRSLEYEEGFCDESGEPNPDMPATRAVVELAENGAGTRMTVTSYFPDAAGMARLVEMGMVEGFTMALDQIDAILAEG